MNASVRKKLVLQIRSPKAEQRRSAAWAMWKSDDMAFAPVILEALKNEKLEDASIWKSKCMMIAALGGLGYREALPFLETLLSCDFSKAPVIYSELGMAICQLKPIGRGRMKFVRETMKSDKALLVCGAYHAIYHLDLDLAEKEIIELIGFAKDYSRRHRQDEQLTCMPRDYLAAAAWRWKGDAVREFLASCRRSKYPHLREIAASSLQGIRPTDSRLGWYR
jgi:hypothetical protein